MIACLPACQSLLPSILLLQPPAIVAASLLHLPPGFIVSLFSPLSRRPAGLQHINEETAGQSEGDLSIFISSRPSVSIVLTELALGQGSRTRPVIHPHGPARLRAQGTDWPCLANQFPSVADSFRSSPNGLLSAFGCTPATSQYPSLDY